MRSSKVRSWGFLVAARSCDLEGLSLSADVDTTSHQGRPIAGLLGAIAGTGDFAG